MFRHIDEDYLERIALGQEPLVGNAYVEEHLLVCEECRNRLVEREQHVKAMRASLRKFTTELIATHQTEDGPIHLYVRQDRDGWWATIGGRELSYATQHRTRDEAERDCQLVFVQTFPEHQCDERCDLSPPPIQPLPHS